MAIVLLIIGAIMVTAAVRNTVATNGAVEGLGPLLAGDFTGQNNYVYWLIAIFVIGAIGYIPSAKNFSNVFLVLIIVALFLSNGGFFAQFQSAISGTTTNAEQNAAMSTVTGVPVLPIMTPLGLGNV